MEVFFQSGEFYNENNFLLELLQIIIPTLAAIAAALLPFWLAKRHERNKENEWRKLNDTSIAITFEKLIEPARKLSDQFIQPVYLPPIMECVAAYDNIEKLKKDYIETFTHIKNALVNNQSIITTEMQNIKDIPLKPASKWI